MLFILRYRACELGTLGQETNSSPLLSNSRLAVPNELKNIPEEQYVTLQYTAAISQLIRGSSTAKSKNKVNKYCHVFGV
jgi:hypothetical protein